VALLSAALCGCFLDGKGQYVEGFGEFVDEVEEHWREYSEADWKRNDQQFRLFSEVYWADYRDRLSPDERERVSAYAERYRACRTAMVWDRIMNSE
jgi:hypothetical protein